MSENQLALHLQDQGESLLPIAQVLKITTLSRSTLYEEMAAGRFPRPVTLSARRVAWQPQSVRMWLNDRAKVADSGEQGGKQ